MDYIVTYLEISYLNGKVEGINELNIKYRYFILANKINNIA